MSKTNSRTGAGSAYRLSRSNTNTTSDGYFANLDNQSIQSIDQVPSAKPSVTYLDKLWTQIDVLDDVKRMAEDSKMKNTLFNDKYLEQLAKLKELQDQLLQTMSALQIEDTYTNEVQKQQLYQLKTVEIESRAEAALEVPSVPSKSEKGSTQDSSRTHETEQHDVREASASSSNELKLSTEEQEKIDKFFAANEDDYDSEDDGDFQSQTIYNKEVFDEINRYVQQVKHDLRGLGEAMKECNSNKDTT